ncbi:MAG: Fe2+-dependent dioxygenase [Gammaproteobacteria bacterium]|nr:Fe2+-dependent dioxygenase [Gammaproteobacteria bacterium]
MLLEILGILDARTLARVQELLEGARFVDGRLSAGLAARRVKHNQEVDGGAPELAELNRLVMGALVRHPRFKSAVLPLRVATPFYARYGSDMTYGDHVDDPVMGAPGSQYRSDVSATVFLSAPETYEGGELVINTAFGPRGVKLAAGAAVAYPSSSLHHVAPVTAGERRVAVTWIQSMIRSPEQRELLDGLNLAREQMLRDAPDAEETKRVDVAYVNLVRMWSEV